MAKIINLESFQNDVLKSEKPVVVYFFAPWCGPCHKFGPIFDELAQELTDYSLLKVNVDDNHELAIQYGIFSIPTLVMFQDGKVVKKETAAGLSVAAVREKIESAF